MFDLTDTARLWISVKWPGLVPGPDDGLAVEVEHEIEVEVEIVDAVELAEIFPPEGVTVGDFFDPFKRLARGWRKFKIGGVNAEFSDENIRKLLLVPMFPQGFENAYYEAFRGKAGAREKNSVSSPPNGRAGGPKTPKATRPSRRSA